MSLNVPDWQLTSEDSVEEIYPTMRVGSNLTRRFEVVNGYISLPNGAVSVSISEFLNRNFSDGLTSADFKSSPLLLEPGKCFIQTVTSVSRAHKKTHLTPQKTCIKRKIVIYVFHIFRRYVNTLFQCGDLELE